MKTSVQVCANKPVKTGGQCKPCLQRQSDLTSTAHDGSLDGGIASTPVHEATHDEEERAHSSASALTGAMAEEEKSSRIAISRVFSKLLQVEQSAGEAGATYEIEDVVGVRRCYHRVKGKNVSYLEYLIKWDGCDLPGC